MAIKESHIDYVINQAEKYPQLCHASNIVNKYSQYTAGRLAKAEKQALELIVPNYVKFLKAMLANSKYTEDAIREKVRMLNTYYNFFHDNELDNAFSSQGKMRPTILEEFLFLLFKDLVEKLKKDYDREDVFHSGSTKAYSNIYFKAQNLQNFIESPEIGINQKDQDYAIYRTFSISVNGADPLTVQIPAVAVEAKTYLDKTMLDSIIATAEKLKSGNPHTWFVAVAESYDVSFDVDPAYSRIDQIYVLRKSRRKAEWADIKEDVVLKLFSDVKTHLERPWSDIRARLEMDGTII